MDGFGGRKDFLADLQGPGDPVVGEEGLGVGLVQCGFGLLKSLVVILVNQDGRPVINGL